MGGESHVAGRDGTRFGLLKAAWWTWRAWPLDVIQSSWTLLLILLYLISSHLPTHISESALLVNVSRYW